MVLRRIRYSNSYSVLGGYSDSQKGWERPIILLKEGVQQVGGYSKIGSFGSLVIGL